MSGEEHAGPSGEPKRRKKDNNSRNFGDAVTGLTLSEVKDILKSVEPDDLYISSSEEDLFVDSGSEYIPSSGSESEDPEIYQISDEVQDLLNIPEDNEVQENESLIEGRVLDQKELEIIWTKNEFNPHIHEFDLTNAVLQDPNLTEKSLEIDYFLRLFTEEIAEVIVQETNKYARQQKAENWNDIDISDLYVFLALTLLMPRNKKLELKEYWSKDILLHSPIFAQQMSRDRYFMIQRYIHFSDNEVAPENNRLYKVENILNMLKQKFQTEFHPFQNIVIDESMVLFKGRLSFTQYIKTKRHRFGIKLYVLCDCETGIVLDFIVYMGKETNVNTQETHNLCNYSLGSTGNVVVKLLDSYLNKGHSLYTDNFYTSPVLSTFLYENKTNSCGTVRQNRKHMPAFERKLKKGETEWRTSDHLLALKWKDRRDVVMLTTMHENKIVTLPQIDRSTNENKKKPLCVIQYNQHMGAIDRSDMLISSVDCTRKSIKWYNKLFFHVIDVCLLNAHAMLSVRCEKKIPLSKFHLAVIRQLLERYPSKLQRPSTYDLGNARLTQRHFPEEVPRKENNKYAVRRCWVCSHSSKSEKKRKETRVMCVPCNVGLCIFPCFKIYHEQAHF
ncbi:piggyBac transposable element-derived protein 4-like [Anthonomus grandis grandis]|uniref:piggyBac transposable element-derived protein 4-like n=1 Tax=Anthonomus grandis grandis TaxID=2921223 RepID=UPI002165D37A|nr:piggyBac transposable element-derived protein 4-like [Anthonomus grandis grandis]